MTWVIEGRIPDCNRVWYWSGKDWCIAVPEKGLGFETEKAALEYAVGLRLGLDPGLNPAAILTPIKLGKS